LGFGFLQRRFLKEKKVLSMHKKALQKLCGNGLMLSEKSTESATLRLYSGAIANEKLKD
jgi:hypothetical protein